MNLKRIPLPGRRGKTLIVLLILLVAIVPIGLFAVNASEYGYNVKITIGTSITSQSNYPVRLHIYNGSGTNSAGVIYLNGHAQYWPYDICFTQSDKSTNVPYWRETFTTSEMYVWVNLPSISSSASTDYYLLYGKSGATDLSNGTNTFTFFDDFLGSSISSARWDTSTVGTTGSASVSGGKLTITKTNTNGKLPTIVAWNTFASRNKSFMVKMTYDVSVECQSGFVIRATKGSANTYKTFCTMHSTASIEDIYICNDGDASYEYTGNLWSWTRTTYATVQIRDVGGAPYFRVSKDYGSETNTSVGFSQNVYFALGFYAINQSGTDYFTNYYDWCAVRTSLVTEPAWSSTGLESAGWAPTYSSSPILYGNNGATYSYHVILNESSTFTLLSGGGLLTCYNNGTIGTSFYLNGTLSSLGAHSITTKAVSVAGLRTAYQNYTLTVNGSWVPTFSSAVTTGQKTVAYSYHITLNCSGIVTAINLPAWLSISNSKNGTSGPWYLNGTPSNAGSYSVKLKANATGLLSYAYQNFTISVSTTWASTFTSSPTLSIIRNATYTYQITTNESASITVLLKPAWLSITNNGTTGTHWLNGSTATPGTYTVNIRATSVPGLLYSYQNFSVQVTIGWGPTFTSSPVASVVIFSSYSYHITLNCSGKVVALLKPAWLTMSNNGTTGLWYLNGTPTVNTSYSISLRAEATAGMSFTYQNYTLVIGTGWAPTYTNFPAISGRVGQAYSFHVLVNESATLIVTFHPAWLTVSNNGSTSGVWVNGTPSSSQVFTLRITANSTNGHRIAYQNTSITISPLWAPTVTSSPNATALPNSTYAYHFIVNESSVITVLNTPAWLTPSANGSTATSIWLNGTPMVVSVYTVKVQAYSVAGEQNAYQNFTITITGWSATFTSSATTLVIRTDSYSYHVTMNESCKVTMLYGPSWATMSNNGSTGAWYVNGSSSANGIYSFGLRAESIVGCGFTWQNFTVTVYSWSVTFTCTGNTSLYEGNTLYLVVTTNSSASFYPMSVPYGVGFVGGVLSGVPEEFGIYSISIRAESNTGHGYSYLNWTLTYWMTWGPTFLSSPSPYYSPVNMTYAYRIILNESAVITVTMPGWATWDFANDSITGFPTVPGFYNITIHAQSVAGNRHTFQNYTLNIYIPRTAGQQMMSTIEFIGPIAIGVMIVLILIFALISAGGRFGRG